MLKVLCASILALVLVGVAPLGAQTTSGSPLPSLQLSQPRLWSRMTEDITRMAKEVDGRVGVFIQGPNAEETFSLHGDDVFPAASTIKLALLLELYKQSEGAKGLPAAAKLTDAYLLDTRDLVEGSAIVGNLAAGTRLSCRDLALFMVVVSDNSAANILMDRVGVDRVNATLQGLGLEKTRLRRKMMDFQAAREGRENLSTPRELAGLLVAIQRGPVLSQNSRSDLLHLLTTAKDGFLTRLLPEELPVANKPGTLPGVRNDAGIIFVKGRPFVIAVMTSHLRDERQGEEAIARIGRRAAACFEVAAAASPEGRIFTPLQVR